MQVAMRQSKIDEIIEMYPDEPFMTVTDMDEAIVGVDVTNFRLVYSVDKIVEILMKDMSYDDAIEYFDFNIAGAYMGEATPIFSKMIDP
jgi:hypothetical protein